MDSSKFNSSSFRPFGFEDKEISSDTKVEKFDMVDWAKQERPTYSQIKETFNKNLPKKDQRFFLSDLVAGQLSVEEEDHRRFESRIKEELEVRVNAIKEEAHKEGFDRGLEKGIEKAFAEERVRIAAQLESLAHAITDLIQSKEKLEYEYEKKLTEFAFQVAETIIESEIVNRPETVTNVIRSILEILSKEEDVKIFLSIHNKKHIDYIKEEISKINRKGSYAIDFKEGLSLGDCHIESMSGEISALISERIKSFKSEIMAQFNLSQTKVAG